MIKSIIIAAAMLLGSLPAMAQAQIDNNPPMKQNLIDVSRVFSQAKADKIAKTYTDSRDARQAKSTYRADHTEVGLMIKVRFRNARVVLTNTKVEAYGGRSDGARFYVEGELYVNWMGNHWEVDPRKSHHNLQLEAGGGDIEDFPIGGGDFSFHKDSSRAR